MRKGKLIACRRWRMIRSISHQAEAWACDETLRSGRQMPDLEVPRLASRAPEKDKSASANAAEVMGRMVQPHDQAWARSEATTKAGTASCIGSDMTIVGKIECNGPAQVFGRIEGELR